MTSRILTIQCGGKGLKIPNLKKLLASGVKEHVFDNRDNLSTPCDLYQMGTEFDEDILIYTHDDLTIHDPDWHERLVGNLFSAPTSPHNQVVAAGFGGAIALGHPHLYKRPYALDDMARDGYMSNQRDAEVHGRRVPGIKRVAVLDAFIMAVRRDFLLSINGWPVNHLTHHCLDLWLACEAARAGKLIWMTGVDCTHHGGGSSIGKAYANAAWLQGGTLERDHTTPHRWLYDSYRDVLPIRVPQ